MNATQILLVALRFLHIVSATIWIGSLYFLNFFQVRPPASAGPPAPPLTPRMLAGFRWSAVATLVTGLAWVVALKAGEYGAGYWSSARFHAVAIGGGIGALMVANTLIVVSGNQKKLSAALELGSDTGAVRRYGRRISVASRLNVIASFTAIAFMVLAGHTGGV